MKAHGDVFIGHAVLGQVGLDHQRTLAGQLAGDRAVEQAAVLLGLFVDNSWMTTVCYITGALSSMIAGFIGMKAATVRALVGDAPLQVVERDRDTEQMLNLQSRFANCISRKNLLKNFSL